jgi:hypothetical protein
MGVTAVRRQPRSPDWTGANAHDPGPTLLELFAFLGEALDYRQSRRRRRLALAALVIVAIWATRRRRD